MKREGGEPWRGLRLRSLNFPISGLTREFEDALELPFYAGSKLIDLTPIAQSLIENTSAGDRILAAILIAFGVLAYKFRKRARKFIFNLWEAEKCRDWIGEDAVRRLIGSSPMIPHHCPAEIESPYRPADIGLPLIDPKAMTHSQCMEMHVEHYFDEIEKEWFVKRKIHEEIEYCEAIVRDCLGRRHRKILEGERQDG